MTKLFDFIIFALLILAAVLCVYVMSKKPVILKPSTDLYIADLQEQIDVLTDRIEILENNQPEFDIIY